MANGAGRIFKLMQVSGTNTISEVITLQVKSINPLQLTDGDKLLITKDFIIFDNNIDTSKLSVGDKLQAQTFNDSQIYYITQPYSSANELNKQNIKLTELERRVKALEDRIGGT